MRVTISCVLACSTQAMDLGQAQSDAALWHREKAALEKGWADSTKRLEAEILRLRDHVANLEHHSRYSGSLHDDLLGSCISSHICSSCSGHVKLTSC